jgi:hypothetical protein
MRVGPGRSQTGTGGLRGTGHHLRPGHIIVDDSNPSNCPTSSRKKTWTCSWAGSRNGPSRSSSGSAFATTTTNERRPWRASWACSTSPGKSTPRSPARCGVRAPPGDAARGSEERS